MTYAEVMALSGRELDAAVVEHVYRREVQWLTISGLRIPRFRTCDGWQVVAEFSCDSGEALSVMAWVLSRGAWARNLFYCTLWAQAGIPARNAANTSNPMAAEAQAARKWVEDALFGLMLEDKLPEAICRAAVYVAMQPQWMGSNDSNQCESDDDAEECDA
jgi:transposase